MDDERAAPELPARLRSGFPLVAAHPDVAGLLRDAELLAELGPALAAPFRDGAVTKVLAPEARGPIVGALVAVELGAGLVLARKAGENHPGADTELVTDPTWKGAPRRFLVRSVDVTAGDRVLLVDDWVTTGHTLAALAGWVGGRSARLVGAAAIVDKTTDDVRARLGLRALVRFADIVGATDPAPPP